MDLLYLKFYCPSSKKKNYKSHVLAVRVGVHSPILSPALPGTVLGDIRERNTQAPALTEPSLVRETDHKEINLSSTAKSWQIN